MVTWLAPIRGPRQRLRVDIFPDSRQFAISNSDVEDKLVLERLICSIDFSRRDADQQNPISLCYEFGGSGYEVSTVSLAF